MKIIIIIIIIIIFFFFVIYLRQHSQSPLNMDAEGAIKTTSSPGLFLKKIFKEKALGTKLP